MRHLRNVAALLCVLAITAGVFAQDVAAPATKPAVKAESVMKHLPAGAADCLIVHSIKDITDQFDQVLADTKLDKMAPMLKAGSLQLLISSCRLGEGFNPNGGFALVVMDPKAFGVDVSAMAPSQTRPAAEPADRFKYPIVIFVPAKSVEDIFASAKTEQAGKLTKVLMNPPLFAAKAGDYIALSPMDTVLEAVLASQKKLSDELTKDQRDLIEGATIANYANLKVLAGPALELLNALMNMAGPGMNSDERTFFQLMLDTVREVLPQFEYAVHAVKYADKQLVVNAMGQWKKDSELGKMFAEMKAPDDLLTKLPNLPYVGAVGGACGGKLAADRLAKLYDTLTALGPLGKMASEPKERFKKAILDLHAQVESFQGVGGAGPETVGGLGFALVLRGKDAAKIQAAINELTISLIMFIKASDPQNSELQKLLINYKKDVEKLGEVSIDAVEIEDAGMSDRNLTEYSKILGERRILIRVAPAGKDTVALTWGGTASMTSAVITAVKEGGTILKGPDVEPALKLLPKDRILMAVFNTGNLGTVIKKVAQQVSPQMGNNAPPFEFEAKRPALLGASYKDGVQRGCVVVPAEIIQDLLKAIMPREINRPQPGGF